MPHFGSAALSEAIASHWAASNLPAVFNTYWPTAKRTEFATLCDGEGSSAQPWPYCVYVIDGPRVKTRMTSSTGNVHYRSEEREGTLEFHIFAKQIPGTIGWKDLGATLRASVMEAFGGHPEEPEPHPSEFGGGIILMQYIDDFPVRPQGSEDEGKWMLRYRFKTDNRVAGYRPLPV